MVKLVDLLDDATLRAIPLLSELSKRELDGVRSICTVKKFKKNAMVFFENDAYAGLYAVLLGSVKVFKNTPDGKEFIVHLLYPYSLVADVPMFGGGNYPANAQTMEATTLLFLPKRDFLEYLEHAPALTHKLLAGFAKRIRTLSQQLENLTLHDVSCRFARFLIGRIEEANRENQAQPMIKLHAQKSVIAAHLGTVIETLSRTLRTLQTEGIIRVNGSTVTVLDYGRLRKLAEL